MLGKLSPYGAIPFFWTRHYNKSLQYIGNGAMGYEEVHVTGDVMANKFLAYYINKEDKVVAVAGQGNTSAILTWFEAMQQNKMPSGADIKNGKETPESMVGKIKQNAGAGKCKRANCCQKKGTQ